jgi:NIMA (never in mitosis gene a)-related kinase
MRILAVLPILSAALALPRPVMAPRPPVFLRSPAPRAALEVVDPSYNLALGSVALGAAFGVPGSPLKNKVTAFTAGPLFLLFGLFIAFQTTNLRFTFDDENFALVKADLSSTGENVVVGGENRWAYKSFVNYDFLPSEDFPILVYFRETQTPVSDREEVPLVVDELDGQVHFFPAISNVKALRQGFEVHRCAKS